MFIPELKFIFLMLVLIVMGSASLGFLQAASEDFPQHQFTENDMEWCEEIFPQYETLGLDWFLENYHYSIEARVCGNLYEDPIWAYQGEDRIQKLLERAQFYLELEIEESQTEAETMIVDPTPTSVVEIPDWIRNNAKWWSEGLISESDFVRGIEYLINQQILVVPLPEDTQIMEMKNQKRAMDSESGQVPDWVKNNAGWWSDGLISDLDFVNGIQYMISSNIIIVDTGMELTSDAFSHNGMIPSEYTCDGADVSPQLLISNVPAGTQSLALIMDDPDAPDGTFVHWVIWNIPLDKTTIGKGEQLDSSQGKTDFGRTGYGGPCPPSDTHRYFFKLYALDNVLDLEAGSTKADLEKAMINHILEQAELVGKYSRN